MVLGKTGGLRPGRTDGWMDTHTGAGSENGPIALCTGSGFGSRRGGLRASEAPPGCWHSENPGFRPLPLLHTHTHTHAEFPLPILISHGELCTCKALNSSTAPAPAGVCDASWLRQVCVPRCLRKERRTPTQPRAARACCRRASQRDGYNRLTHFSSE